MTNKVMIAAVAGVLGGIFGSVGMKAMSSSDGSQAPATELSEALTPDSIDLSADLARELADLRRENKELSLRMASLEARSPASSREQVGPGDATAIAELQDSVAALAAALKNPQSAPSAGLRQMVATALEEVQSAEQEERATEREQRDIDRIVERMDDYAEKLGLDAVQRKSMQDVLIDSSAKRTELFTSMREGNLPRDEMRETFRTHQAQSEAALGQILTPQQLEDYNEMNDGGRGGFFGGGRGGRGGGN